MGLNLDDLDFLDGCPVQPWDDAIVVPNARILFSYCDKYHKRPSELELVEYEYLIIKSGKTPNYELNRKQQSELEE